MNYEKAYKEMMQRARELHEGGNALTKQQMEIVCPELAESEDERIRKELMCHIQGEIDTYDNMVSRDYDSRDKEDKKVHSMLKRAITYLEKQKVNTEGDFARGYDCGYECCLNSHGAEWFEKQKEQSVKKKTPTWMPKFLDELRSKKTYFDWDEHRDMEGSILAIIDFIAPDYFKQKEQKPIKDKGAIEPTTKQDYSGLTDFERAIHRGFLCAGVENVPIEIIKETAQDCIDSMPKDGIAHRLLMKGEITPSEYIRLAYPNKKELQKPKDNPKWTELTWKDINELERIINNVRYEFQNGIGEDSFGKLVLERFREYKDDDSIDEQKPAEWRPYDREVFTKIKELIDAHFSEHEQREIFKNWLDEHISWPAEWSDNDNIGWDEAFACVTLAEKAAKNEEELQNAVTTEKWLKKIKFKYYVNPVTQEWSEEDERKLKMLHTIVRQAADAHTFFTTTRLIGDKDAIELQEFLKSLRPQPHWKPSEEQMGSLRLAIDSAKKANLTATVDTLIELYEQLKKL